MGQKESLSKTLNGYLGDIAARQKLVDALVRISGTRWIRCGSVRMIRPR
ncbi:MAG: hypothetical protein ACLVAT_12550 [Lachnospiraceae bacterium]